MGTYHPDTIDGRRVPPTVITTDAEISDTHTGTVHVEGGRLTLWGTLRGTLVVHRGSEAVIHGTQAGTVYVKQGALVSVLGALNGETYVEQGASVIVEPSGRLAGGLVNEGRVVVRGVFGGARRGEGTFVLEAGGRIKRPELIDGITTYIWRDRE